MNFIWTHARDDPEVSGGGGKVAEKQVEVGDEGTLGETVGRLVHERALFILGQQLHIHALLIQNQKQTALKCISILNTKQNFEYHQY